MRTFEAGLAEVARLNGVGLREGGRMTTWCGHRLLGQLPNRYQHLRCGNRDDSWWDHARGFGAGRRPRLIMGWPDMPRVQVEEKIRAYAEPLGLAWGVGDPEGPLSFYFYGRTTPWVLAAPDVQVWRVFANVSPALDEVMVSARGYADYRRVNP
jgi:hypothetical protein